jgi:site-specific DNA recombinase
MKAIGYIRVSTEQQAGEGVSLEAQRAKIEAWCLANDCELAGMHVDAGISGKSMEKRQGLQKALAETGKGMVLVVYSLSRLARSTKDTLAISERLDKAGADLVSISERIDTTGAAGKMMFRILAVLAEFERDVVSERTTMALAHKKARGEKYAPVPFGYQEIEGRLEAIESEAQVVAEIVRRRNSGETLQAIADRLNEQGTPSKRGGTWRPCTISYIIQRQAA